MKNKRLLRDILIVAVILVICLALLLVRAPKTAGQWVIVRIDSVEAGRYDLNVNASYELNGGTNTLVIENRQAYISHANCPDQICVNQGKIWGSGQMIVCLPNRVTVTVEGVSSGVDMVS